ncbi:MAG: right-handed parallel beta-helix repeat-containing protein [Acidobacteria bacterium]|nr:right-handed parallel beta-helix repeat-containing protein [Acidobacteriota bacterium]
MPHRLKRGGGLIEMNSDGSIDVTSGAGFRVNGAGLAYKRGQTWFVDPNDGSDTLNTGKTWTSPYATMSKAFSVLSSGDTILFVGKVREQLTTPVQVFDVTIIGAGNRPRHADSTPAGGEEAAATWTTPASGATTAPLCDVLQQGWKFVNTLFAGPSDHSCVRLYRDGGAGDAERDASHAEFHGCRFASGQDGIEQSGGCYNVGIFDCSFHDLTGYALKHTAGAGIANPYRWQIHRNRFHKNANFMGVWNTHNFEIHDNTILRTTTALIDLSGGEGYNTILRNAWDIAAADFDPTGGVTGHSTDVWSNYLKDALESGLPAN